MRNVYYGGFPPMFIMEGYVYYGGFLRCVYYGGFSDYVYYGGFSDTITIILLCAMI